MNEEINQVLSNGVRVYLATEGDKFVFRMVKPGLIPFELIETLEIDEVYLGTN